MDIHTKRKAQHRLDRIASFREELKDLEAEQALALSADQRSRLEAHFAMLEAGLARRFGLDTSDSARRISWGMRTVALLGAAALFAAIALFLHRVWGLLPTAAHVLLLTGITLAFLTGAEWTHRKRADGFYTGLLVLAAGVAFVMELSAMAGIFNIAPSPHALLLWSAFGLLTGIAYGIWLVFGAGVVLGCAYVASLLSMVTGSYWTSFLEHQQYFLLPPAITAYAIPWIAPGADPHGLRVTGRLCGTGMGLVALFSLSVAGHLCCAGMAPRTIEGLYQLVGLFLSGAVVGHGLKLGTAGLVNLGSLMFVIFLYARLHAWWWDWMPKYLFFLLIGFIALVLLFLFRWMRANGGERGST